VPATCQSSMSIGVVGGCVVGVTSGTEGLAVAVSDAGAPQPDAANHVVATNR